MTNNLSVRIQSIDVFRAVTMFLMIFVNDLWSISGVPEWLEHTRAEEDGMGFSDVIFPLFLFIVGLSIPLAINIRLQKGDPVGKTSLHILTRTMALLIMGFFMVNFEYLNAEATGMNRHLWEFLMALGIFLIWMDYKGITSIGNKVKLTLKAFGILLLIFLALIYKGGELSNPEWMQVHWWGILGLIGWAYALNSFLYLYLRKHKSLLIPVFLLLIFMNVQENAYFELFPAFKIVISASNHLLVMGGVLTTTLFLYLKNHKNRKYRFTSVVLVGAILLIAYGFMVRSIFPVSKILATPSWTAICLGIAMISLMLFYWIVDQGKYTRWAIPIRAAGTSTLTCYLMPYFFYPLIVWSGIKLPEWSTHGVIGLLKCLLFSLGIILFVRFLERKNIKMKV